eukprot:CAMPEP_0201108686 /NCGR_PEP_ID=MMETSP0812-20130820/62647_1 /ASSEMBLY_ACC=CAM_ASM_000668 /TAXON_ID=98059 /ORGANISM="Dinobryon sp., Strain UTEXLB2267" /LENGTH=311 /DNA_ID=CAMNT_0047370251 /DNA_START=179 /DNA_END=1114 /DNA_ORIENTATION=+
MAVQEISNVMYTLPILTFDTDYSVPYSTDSDVNNITNTSKPTKSKATKKSITVATNASIDSKNSTVNNNEATSRKRHSTELLWDIHRLLISRFLQIDPAHYNPENYDCFAIYFELMRALPYTRQLVLDVIHSQNNSNSMNGGDSNRTYYYSAIPEPSGPTAAIPSRLHASTVQVMQSHLQFESNELEVFHEFNGLHGVFAVDTAVFYRDELIALVEVDGESHYKQLSQQLRRKDKLKEFLYQQRYSVPLYRMRMDQISAIGASGAGRALASWIVKDLHLKNKDKSIEETQPLPEKPSPATTKKKRNSQSGV